LQSTRELIAYQANPIQVESPQGLDRRDGSG
jgi:hypothetical protein